MNFISKNKWEKIDIIQVMYYVNFFVIYLIKLHCKYINLDSEF